MPGEIARSLLSQMMQEDAQAKARQERQQEIAAQRELDMIQHLVQSGASGEDLLNSAPLLQHTSASTLRAYSTIADITRKKEKEQQKLAETLNPQILSTLSQGIAARAGPRGMQPAPLDQEKMAADELTRRTVELNQLGRPELIPELMGRVGAGRLAAEANSQEAVATESRADQRAAASQSRAAAIQDAQSAVDAEAVAIAGAKRGGLSNVDTSLAAVTQRLAEGGHPNPALGARKAIQKARAEEVDIAKWERSVNGKGQDSKVIEAQADRILERFPDAAVTQPGERLSLLRNLTLVNAGQMAIDPYMASKGNLAFMDTLGPKDADRLNTKRRDLIEVDAQYSELSRAYDSVKAAGAAGPGTFEGLYDVGAFTGNQPPEVADYRNAAFIYGSALLKAYQGSRPSEFDLKRFLLLQPALSEIGTPSGDAKIAGLQRMLTVQAMAPFDPKAQAQLREVDEQLAKSRDGAKLDRWVAKANAELGPDGTGTISQETLSGFLKAADTFTTSGDAEKLRKLAGQKSSGAGPAAGLPANFNDVLGGH